MALGARTGDVLKMVIGQGMKLALIGVRSRIDSGVRADAIDGEPAFKVTATDPLTFAVITLLLTGVALGACFVPARRATKVDPMVALGYE